MGAPCYQVDGDPFQGLRSGLRILLFLHFIRTLCFFFLHNQKAPNLQRDENFSFILDACKHAYFSDLLILSFED